MKAEDYFGNERIQIFLKKYLDDDILRFERGDTDYNKIYDIYFKSDDIVKDRLELTNSIFCVIFWNDIHPIICNDRFFDFGRKESVFYVKENFKFKRK